MTMALMNMLHFNLVLLQFLGKQLLGNIRGHVVSMLFPGNQIHRAGILYLLYMYPVYSSEKLEPTVPYKTSTQCAG